MYGANGTIRFLAIMPLAEAPPGGTKPYYLGGLACAARLRRGIGWIAGLLVIVGVFYALTQAK